MQSFTFPLGLQAMSSAPFRFEPDGEMLTSAVELSEIRCYPERMLVAVIPFVPSAGAQVYGDGFQMLAQTTGTLARPIDVGRCPDNNNSYRIYPKHAAKRYYNYLVVEDGDQYWLFGFTSCHRFAGYFEWYEGKVHVYLDGENVVESESKADSWLESFTVLKSSSLSDLYEQYAALIKHHHPPRETVTQPAPIGWCSWYAYYAGVSEQDIQRNVNEMQGELELLEWVLLDDGYQAYMGDWLTPSDRFANGVKALICDIKARGKKPGIWLAPFIAQPESELFRSHPEWFVKHDNGELLKAGDITYGGWRCTPWYILDTSHPGACAYLTEVVTTMREEWGVELFKLDANYWGTLKGRRHQPGVTGVQAYRMGMAAIAQGAGTAWLLGCNAPMWPSLGLVDAMRVSDDVERHPQRFSQIAQETFYRSWQHRRLWQIDPDCATLTSIAGQSTTPQAYQFHRDVLTACGGLLLSGDPLYSLDTEGRHALVQLIERQGNTQEPAIFGDLSLHSGRLRLNDAQQLHLVFNYYGQPGRTETLTAEVPVYWSDYRTGELLMAEPCISIVVELAEGIDSRAIVASRIS